MQHFEYVPKNEWKPVRKELIELIHDVQDQVRERFTFDFKFIGSSSRNMITCDKTTSKGYDFDINIYPNDEEDNYSPKEIKTFLMNAMNKVCKKYGYDYAEDSTRVITIKVKDHKKSKIIHSADFAIVKDLNEDEQLYVRYNKSSCTYSWEHQPQGYCSLKEKEEWCLKNGLEKEIKDTYLKKKNNNTVKDKKSRSLYAETINEIYNKY